MTWTLGLLALVLALSAALAVASALLVEPAPTLAEDGRQHAADAVPTESEVEADAQARHAVAVWALCRQLGIDLPSMHRAGDGADHPSE